MKTKFLVLAAVVAVCVGLFAASGCPVPTPANQVITKDVTRIVGTYEIYEWFITFNEDGTFLTDFYGTTEGPYFIVGDHIILDFAERGGYQSLEYVGHRDDEMLVVALTPLMQFTPPN